MDQKIMMKKWQDYILSLSDKDFSALMHLYLGDFKTPYNKQNLIEQLARFIREANNRSNLLLLLDEDDLDLLSAVRFLPHPTKTRLCSFFNDSNESYKTSAKVENLTNRLWLFTDDFNLPGMKVDPIYRINPLLADEVESLLSVNRLFSSCLLFTRNIHDTFSLSPNFMASLISFVKTHKISCKNDGSLRKSDMNALELIFPGHNDCIQLLIQAFIALRILSDDGKSLCVEEKRLAEFARLSEEKQYILLAVAAKLGSSRSTLQKNAALLQNILYSIPQTGFTQKDLVRLSFFAGNDDSNTNEVRGSLRAGATAGGSRFARMMEQHARAAQSPQEEGEQNAESGDFMELIIDTAREFGLLRIMGLDENGTEIYCRNEFSSPVNLEFSPKVLNMSASSIVTLMPGLTLFNLLPLTDFLSPKNCSVVSEFEITKSSASKAFDKGLDPQKIAELLKENTAYELPQSLLANLDDWYNSYTAATLYQGYVLRVKDPNFAENNPLIASHIVDKIAPGVYLLDIPPTESASDFVKNSGLNLLANIRQVPEKKEFLGLPQLRIPVKVELPWKNDENASSEKPAATDQNGRSPFQFLASLSQKVRELNLPEIQTLVILGKIRHHLIISESQINSTMNHMEVMQVRGTDYQGKLHLLESMTKKEDALVEVSFPDESQDFKQKKIIGRPVELFTSEKGILIRLLNEKSGVTEEIPVSQISQLTTLSER